MNNGDNFCCYSRDHCEAVRRWDGGDHRQADELGTWHADTFFVEGELFFQSIVCDIATQTLILILTLFDNWQCVLWGLYKI